MIIDSHAHIYYDSFNNDLQEVLDRALNSGVKKIICVGVDLESSTKWINLAHKFDNIYATVGFHPHESNLAEKNYLKILESMAQDLKVVAIGEIGLDYHYNHSEQKTQEKVFLEQLELAKSINLPAVVHSRNADEETIKIISKVPKSVGVVHCFASNLEQALKVIELDYYISFTGLITFAHELTDVIKNISLDNMLIESDSPYLSPIPFRGKRNEPSNIVEIIKKISEIKNISLSDVENITSKNTLSLFQRIVND